MKTSKKQFLRYCALPLAAILLAWASESGKKNGAPINHFIQPPAKDTFHPKNCSTNLVTHYQYSTAQIITEEDVSYAKPSFVHKDVMYGVANGTESCNHTADSCGYYEITHKNSLRYKLYYPDSALHDYIAKPLGVIFLFHPGGFAECHGYDVQLMNLLADEFSRKGFIVANVEYRRGKLEDGAYTSVQDGLATCRGQQDGRGAIRSFMKRQAEAVANGTWKYLIDTSQIFVGGASAGGVIALSCAYYKNQGMMDAVNPHDPVSLAMSNTAILGTQNADYYYAAPGSQYWPRIAGVMNLWGGIPIPKGYDNKEDSFFTGGGSIILNTPLIAFHGNKDDVVKFKDNYEQDVLFSKLPAPFIQDFHSENRCLNSNNYYSVKSFEDDDTILVKRCSSLNMYNVLKKLGIFTELYYDCNGGHGLGANVEFGIGTDSTVLVTRYIAQRVAIFFQAIMNHTAPGPPPFGLTGRSVFRDCENFRNSCNPYSDTECNNNDSTNYKACLETE